MGIFQDLGDVISDVGDFVKGVLGGAGNVLGLIVSAGAVVIAGPGYAMPVFVGTTAAANAVIRQRRLTPHERHFVEQVFGASLPANHRIILTNLAGAGGRAFVVPHPNTFGEYIVNLGSDAAFDNPTLFCDQAHPAPGQLLIHELTHVWQMLHSSFTPGFLCEAVATQFRHSVLGDDVYNRTGIYGGGALGKHWRQYNPEEQATIVDGWFHQMHGQLGLAFRSPPPAEARLRPYIDDAVRAGNPGADYRWILPNEFLARLMTDGLPGVFWRVSYSDGSVRHVTFLRDGAAAYEPPPSPLHKPAVSLGDVTGTVSALSASRAGLASASLGAASRSLAQSSRTSTIVAAPAARGGGISLAAASATTSVGGVRPPPAPTGAILPASGRGSWRYEAGKILIQWNVGSEEWDVPIDLASQTGRSRVHPVTFTARKVVPGGSSTPVLR